MLSCSVAGLGNRKLDTRGDKDEKTTSKPITTRPKLTRPMYHLWSSRHKNNVTTVITYRKYKIRVAELWEYERLSPRKFVIFAMRFR